MVMRKLRTNISGKQKNGVQMINYKDFMKVRQDLGERYS